MRLQRPTKDHNTNIRLQVPGAIICAILLCFTTPLFSQGTARDIYSDYVLYNKRVRLDKDLRGNVTAKAFAQDLDSNNEHKFESACLAVSQFLFTGDNIKNGFDKLITGYDRLEFDTKRAFLEAVYAVYPDDYFNNIRAIILKESDPDLFAIAAVYLLRHESSIQFRNELKIRMVEAFPAYDSLQVLVQLEKYINGYGQTKIRKLPDLTELFEHQKTIGRKTVYSFQRWNRDFPGLAVIQHANGHFARDSNGRLLVYQQLARSASDLPYFITNGSTPQGVFSLQGTAVSKLNWIGPTPNLQMVMPFEHSWTKYFHQPIAPRQDSLAMYKQLFPGGWRSYAPMMEVWDAGKTGRSQIIAHGTTIDPAYYSDRPFYPLTPTMGCLCAREEWNVTTGRIQLSEQYGLSSTYNASPGKNGYLYVINVDDQQKEVTRDEVERWVKQFERR